MSRAYFWRCADGFRVHICLDLRTSSCMLRCTIEYREVWVMKTKSRARPKEMEHIGPLLTLEQVCQRLGRARATG